METTEKCIIGVDVGGTNIRIGKMAAGQVVENSIKVPLKEILRGDGQPEKLAAFIAEYCHGFPVASVAVGLPGTLDRNCSRVLNTPNIPGLSGSNLKRILQSHLKIPVFLENDAVMLLSGDICRLQLEPRGIYLGCYIGTGLGGAIFIDGSVPKGANGVSEIGHIPVFGKNDPCSCGNRGCAENYVSGRYLQNLRLKRFPDRHISEMFSAIKGTEEYYGYIEILSTVLAGALNLMDPNALIIGGGVASMKDFPKAELYERIYYHAMKPVPAESLNVLYPPEREDAGVFGAVQYARRVLSRSFAQDTGNYDS